MAKSSGHSNHLAHFNRQDFRACLLAWYDANARDLPWRARPGAKKRTDPYRVWVSEIMLQQTRVAAVIAHYREFLTRFPSVRQLAGAKEASVLAAWSGLGYYRRARMLHAAAKAIVRERDGKFPSTADEWRELPGIGRYTAAAIASIAFKEAAAVVDGNVKRVVQRITGKWIDGETLWLAAEELLDRDRPGDFNQAMMELGATICSVQAPACLTCPVSGMCATRGELPEVRKRERQRKREIHYALHCQSGNGGARVFLVRRPRDASLMAGMWELPEIEAPIERDQPVLTVRHSITVTDYTVKVWRSEPFASSGEWVAVKRLKRVALTGLARKILQKAEVMAGVRHRSHPKSRPIVLGADIKEHVGG